MASNDAACARVARVSDVLQKFKTILKSSWSPRYESRIWGSAYENLLKDWMLEKESHSFQKRASRSFNSFAKPFSRAQTLNQGSRFSF